MKIRLLVLSVFLSFTGFTQDDYHPLIRPDLQWDIVQYSNFDFLFPSSVSKYFFGGDTLIGDQIYTKILYHPYVSENNSPSLSEWLVDGQVTLQSNLYLRENLDQRRVYLYDSIEETEGLIYDFSLEVGDTLYYHHPIGIDYESVVLDIEMVPMTNGELRKMFYLDIGEEYVEGVGSVYYGIQMPMMANLSGGGNVLDCMQENGEVIWGSGFNGQCGQYLSTEIDEEFDDLAVYPNPFQSHMAIRLRHGHTDAEFMVNDIQGRIVLQGKIGENQSIDCSGMPDGVYSLRVFTEEGKVLKQMIVKN